MRIGSAAVLVATLWCSASAGKAQPLVSEADVAAFQGTWVLDLVRSGLPESAAERRVIATDTTAMRVDVYRPRDVRPFTLVFNLDGSPTTNPFGDGTAVSRLRREGPRLLTETVYTVKEHPVTVRELLPPFHGSTPPGVEMAIEVTMRVEHGYQGAPSSLESPPNATKATKVFTKQP
jgi:hypothetical protein